MSEKAFFYIFLVYKIYMHFDAEGGKLISICPLFQKSIFARACLYFFAVFKILKSWRLNSVLL
jgi:hypothetical protein